MSDKYIGIPIIKLWHLLLVPLQGELTDDLADQLTTEVLERIHQDGSSGLVIDITALWMVDSHLCSVLSQLSASASLMGAKTVICGMKPEIALTLETMGVQLGATATTLTLEGALEVLGARTPHFDGHEVAAAPLAASREVDSSWSRDDRPLKGEGMS
jgi:rsbT antagonist protein RsbS